MKLTDKLNMATLLTLALIGLLQSTNAAEINIDRTIKYVAFRNYVEVPAQKYGVYALGQYNVGDSLLVEATPMNQLFKRLDVYICSKSDYQFLLAGQPNGCRGLAQQRAAFRFLFKVAKPETHYLVVDNTISAMATKKANLMVTATKQLSQDEVRQYRGMFNSFMNEVETTFITPKFNLNFQPCGQSNAFSASQGGHITMCSELFYELASQNLVGAIGGVMFHELGHTLLNLWELPGWNNEETADEFALYMFYRDGVQERALDWITWLSTQNSAQQAIVMLEYGDKHPLSIQRIRNAKAILNNPGPFMERWNHLIYPHMTNQALTRIANNPQKYDNAKLAQTILDERK